MDLGYLDQQCGDGCHGLDAALIELFSDVYADNQARHVWGDDDNWTFGNRVHRNGLSRAPQLIPERVPGTTVEIIRRQTLVVRKGNATIWSMKLGSKIGDGFNPKKHMGSKIRRSMVNGATMRLFYDTPTEGGLQIGPLVEQPNFYTLAHVGSAQHGLQRLLVCRIERLAENEFSFEVLHEMPLPLESDREPVVTVVSSLEKDTYLNRPSTDFSLGLKPRVIPDAAS